MLEKFINIQIQGSEKKPILIDVFLKKDTRQKPVIVYVHGFKGFKDWGNSDRIAAFFVENGFVFIKFNFSHNGMSPSNYTDFLELENFGNNNASKELHDIEIVLDWVSSDNIYLPSEESDKDKIYLIGHSRGGGVAIVKGSEDPRIRKIVTWAAITEFSHIWKNFTHAEMEHWKSEGVAYVINARTRQQLPLYYQLYEDYIKNLNRLNILKAAASLKIPFLICHGTNDGAVPVENATLLFNHAFRTAQLFLLEGADHVFERKHPPEFHFSVNTQKALLQTEIFLKS